ncbi:DUF1534 domain-containing protein [Pseudomonas salomonii]|uniref:DUF1534 domain-containing protein n=1 Tax=Pseudomonas salomonii TaxID=191391 RepID=A0ABS9GG00_9PSED|nr:DUF1534 domain-containing protein [Pseudomonas salomonii]
MRGNASSDAPRHAFKSGRRASRAAFPRRAWERSTINKRHQMFSSTSPSRPPNGPKLRSTICRDPSAFTISAVLARVP